jgi:hypothetical protein
MQGIQNKDYQQKKTQPPKFKGFKGNASDKKQGDLANRKLVTINSVKPASLN